MGFDEFRSRSRGRLSIGRGGQNRPMNRFPSPSPGRTRPSASEQFGMTRKFAHRPQSPEVPTSPRPKWPCQIRLTITRVERGLSGRQSRGQAQASPVDRGADGDGSILAGAGSMADRNPGKISSFFRSPGMGSEAFRADIGSRHHQARFNRLHRVESMELVLARSSGLLRTLDQRRDLLVLVANLTIGQGAIVLPEGYVPLRASRGFA